MKKLIRTEFAKTLKPEEIDYEYNIEELKRLYLLKIKEELNEIIDSDYKDIFEYADLIEAIYGLAEMNNINRIHIMDARMDKFYEKGGFTNVILKKLNPANASNRVYLEDEELNHKFYEI